jgi:hypothetical protein
MAPPPPQTIIDQPDLTVDRYEGSIFVLTMKKLPENRIDSAYAQKLIAAYNTIRKTVGEDAEGAVITRGSDEKFWCTVCHVLSLSFSHPLPHTHTHTHTKNSNFASSSFLILP